MAIPSRAASRAKKPAMPSRPHWGRWALAGGAAVVVYAFLVGPVVHLGDNALAMKRELRAISHQEKAKDWSAMVAEMPSLSRHLQAMGPSMARLDYLNVIPGIRAPFMALHHLILAGGEGITAIDTVLPTLNHVAPLFGFRTTGSKVTPRTMNGREKIQAVIKALPRIVPELNRVYPTLSQANREFQLVNPSSLSLLGPHTVHEVSEIKNLSNIIIKNLPGIQQEIPVLQKILGIPTPQKYLLFFENSGELRPGGGFMTSYAFLPFRDGKMGKITPKDIYSLPNGHYFPPPNPMYAQAFGNTISYLRDANTSPDIPISASNIYQFYDSMTSMPPVNGMIFIDTWFVDRLIADVGGLTLAQPYNVHITEANANYEMEYLSERAGFPGPERKAFIGVMLKQLLAKVMHAHGSELTSIIGTVGNSLNQKLVTLYFNNTAEENFVAKYNWGGIIPPQVPHHGEYLQVVDENIGGHKDNYFLHEAIDTTVTKNPSGQKIATSKITWTNPAIYNDWTVVPYEAYIRVYAPMGSTLVSMTGENEYLQVESNPTENKTWFGGHITMPVRMAKSDPPATYTMTVTYALPAGTNLHTWLIQKEPGVLSQSETINVGHVHYSFNLTRDTLLTLRGISTGTAQVVRENWR